MAFTMPTFASRLLRPFTQSTRMGLSSDGAAGSVINVPEGAEKAILAAGCFWGVEHIFRKHFSGKGLLDARVGYVGGDKANPSYNQVCSGRTGHAEATLLIYDPKKVTYRQLLEFFYKTHDPTTLNRQGNDRGTQYRSGIVYTSPEQEKVAREVTEAANKQWWDGNIKTQIVEAGPWWDAEEYHQKYLYKEPNGYTCNTHYVRTEGPFGKDLKY